MRCPHGNLCGRRGDCAQCEGQYALRADPATMSADEREAELREILDGPSFATMDAVWPRVDALVGRPTFNHEWVLLEELCEEARTWRHPADLAQHAISSLTALVGPDKPIVVVEVR